MTEAEASKCLLILKAAYPRTGQGEDPRLVAATEELYVRELQALRSVKTTEQAMQEHIRTCRWYPTVSEIRALYDRFDAPAASGQLALPPARGTSASKRQHAAAVETVSKILGCDHSDPRCQDACIHRQAYEEAFRT